MKSVIVYFSLEGNSKYVAEKISGHIGADIVRLDPEKGYPKGNVSKFFWGGKSVVLGETPKLMSYNFNQNDYDLIIIGTPIWAGTFTPPIKTFIKENNLDNKKIALYACNSGGGAEKCFNKFKKVLYNSDIIATLSLVDPKVRKLEKDDEKIKAFCNELNLI